MTTYLENRQQAVYLEGQLSSILNSGPRSVVQGSGMSCILFLIFTLDLPLIFEDARITIEKIEKSTEPDSIGYVDDNFIHIKKNKSLQESLEDTMSKIAIYMSSNLLSLNRDKTQLLVLSKSSQLKQTIMLPAIPKNIVHKPTLKILGIEITDELNWRHFVLDGKASIKKQLITRLNSLKILRRTANNDQLRKFTNGIFMSKIYYGQKYGQEPHSTS